MLPHPDAAAYWRTLARKMQGGKNMLLICTLVLTSLFEQACFSRASLRGSRVQLRKLISKALKTPSVMGHLPFVYFSTLHALDQRDSEPCRTLFTSMREKELLRNAEFFDASYFWRSLIDCSLRSLALSDSSRA